MQNDSLTPRLPVLIVLAIVLFLVTLISRETSGEVFPAFLSLKQKNIYVELTMAGSIDGVYQINDGSALCDVIKLTHISSMDNFSDNLSCNIPLVSGRHYVIAKKALGIEILERRWMKAGKRMALAIPLHPDHMNFEDWQELPGIGEKLAEKIELYRQNNGAFGSFENLIKVKGIGPKRLERWKAFFVAA